MTSSSIKQYYDDDVIRKGIYETKNNQMNDISSMLLLDKINRNKKEEEEDNITKDEIKSIIYELETNYSNINNKKDDKNNTDNIYDNDDMDRFQPALGLYDVKYVQTTKMNDNPVGGKWTRKNKLSKRLVSIKRTMQHLLPVNATTLGKMTMNCTQELRIDDAYYGDGDDIRPVVAEAINVITLQLLWDMIHLNIILRGDAVPLSYHERKSSMFQKDDKSDTLSNLAVKAFFDRPRIILSLLRNSHRRQGKNKKQVEGRGGEISENKKSWLSLGLSIGPKSSVVLDTTYLDNQIRIGKGGTSGTRFVFERCKDNDLEAQQFRSLILQKTTNKAKLLAMLGVVSIMTASSGGNHWLSFRGLGNLCGSKLILNRLICMISSFLFLGVLFSSGGIEERDSESERIKNSQQQ